MIANPTEYQKAQEEIRALEERLERLHKIDDVQKLEAVLDAMEAATSPEDLRRAWSS